MPVLCVLIIFTFYVFLNLYSGTIILLKGFPGGSEGKESTCNLEDLGSIPGLKRSPGGGHGSPLQYSCLEHPHGQRGLAGCRAWGRRESDATEPSTLYSSKALLAVWKSPGSRGKKGCLFIPLDIFSKQVTLLLLASSQSWIRQSLMQTNHGDFALHLIKTVKPC